MPWERVFGEGEVVGGGGMVDFEERGRGVDGGG